MTAIIIFTIIFYVLLIIANWMLFEKAGEAGWKSIIPFYNAYIQFKIVWGSGWFFLLMLIPFANIVISIIFDVKMARAYGQSDGFAVGLVFLPFIFQLILAFGSA